MIKQQIIDQLQQIIKELGVSDTTPQLDIPTDFTHGDYTTNVAFQSVKRQGRSVKWASPLDLANEIASRFTLHALPFLQKVEAVKPGFVNFWISKEELLEEITRNLHDTENIYTSIQAKSKKFEMYENIGPNTNKPLHIGHVRNMTLGISIVNLRKALDHKVWSVNINNDRGIHIIKCIWSYLQFGQHEFRSIDQVKDFTLPASYMDWREILKKWFSDNTPWYTPKQLDKKPDHYLGIFYMLGDKAAKEYPDTTEQMKEMLLAWENGETHVRLLWELMNGWFYEGFRQTHSRYLGISTSDQQFDKEWYESELYQAGRQMILDNLGKGVFYKREDNVIMANLEKYNLPDKVVIRSDGSSLYITFDLEEAREMAQDYKADLIAHIVSNEQELYFKQVFALIDALKIAPKENFLHIAYGTVYLKSGAKMSSREGTVILADDLMDLIKTRIKESFKDITDDVAEAVAIGAIKYTILKYNPKADMNFDIEQSISVEGNSGPYIQYTYARTQSILKKGKALSVKGKEDVFPSNLHADSLLYNKAHYEIEESYLLRQVFMFPEFVQKAAESYSPNVVCEYLFKLAQEFNLFYQKYRIIDAATEEDKVFRLFLTQAVGETLQEGLRLLGIAAPGKM